MTRVVVIGCGVVGAAIAYELSLVPGLKVSVLDRQAPAQASTGAALGVLMGIISKKTKGRAWQLRRQSLERYETLIPELRSRTGLDIPWNQQGILKLCFDAGELPTWRSLAEQRQAQGWPLEILDAPDLARQYSYLAQQDVAAAIYSPRDRQIQPVALTQALVAAAQQNGVTFQFDQAVESLTIASERSEAGGPQVCQALRTGAGAIAADWFVIAAGLGSTPLTAHLHTPIPLGGILGQAVRLRLPAPLAQTPQPVVTGDDVHLVPLSDAEYWLGATVEFPADAEHDPIPEGDRLQSVIQRATEFCPALAKAEILQTWSGLRPRPSDRPAPVIGPLAGYQNVLLATGHYRNGVLLAPATALAIRAAIAPL